MSEPGKFWLTDPRMLKMDDHSQEILERLLNDPEYAKNKLKLVPQIIKPGEK